MSHMRTRVSFVMISPAFLQNTDVATYVIAVTISFMIAWALLALVIGPHLNLMSDQTCTESHHTDARKFPNPIAFR
jgi:hypothetical protein